MKYATKENGPVVLTVQTDHVDISQTLPWDCDGEQFIQAVYAAMIGMTFSPETVISAMRDFVEEHDS